VRAVYARLFQARSLQFNGYLVRIKPLYRTVIYYMLSVVIIAKNEGINIRRCLESVQWADEIIVLDSGSCDATVAIAKEFTEKVFTTDSTDWQGYGVQKQRALAHATMDWVLNLDADESVDAHLKQTLLLAMKASHIDAYRIPVRMYFYGKPLRYSSSPKRHIRLFRREIASYSSDIVHEKILLTKDARIGKVKEAIMHHSFYDVSHLLYKMNRYSSFSAKIRISEKRRASLFKTMLGTSWMFFRCYFVQRGFLDGREGFLFALFSAQGSFYRGIKQIYRDQPIHEELKGE
jgi:glycosyltransferase involved in cell wall biosynthesis